MCLEFSLGDDSVEVIQWDASCEFKHVIDEYRYTSDDDTKYEHIHVKNEFKHINIFDEYNNTSTNFCEEDERPKDAVEQTMDVPVPMQRAVQQFVDLFVSMMQERFNHGPSVTQHERHHPFHLAEIVDFHAPVEKAEIVHVPQVEVQEEIARVPKVVQKCGARDCATPGSYSRI